MKRRYFSMFEKIKFFCFDTSILIGLIWLMISLPLAIMVIKTVIIEEEMALYHSPSYTEGTDTKVKKQSTKSNPLYNHTILYQVNGKSYEVILANAISDTIKEKVKVKYLAEAPAISTAEDLSMGMIIFHIVFMSAIPCIGFPFFSGIKKLYQNLTVLENGEIALGKFLRSETLSTSKAKHSIMKLYFSFRDKDGNEQETSVETHLTKKLQDEPLKMLVYMPNDAGKSVFLDIVPSFVRKKLEVEFEK